MVNVPLSFSVALFLAFPLFVNAATLSASPSVASVKTGERITLSVNVSSPSTPINAISGVLTVPPFLSIESVSRSGSILNFWVTEPTYSNTTKTVSFEGVSLSGFQGVSGSVLTATLRAASTGTGRISFQSGQILANDGIGTDVTEDLIGASIDVTQRLTPESTRDEVTPTPESEKEPEPEKTPASLLPDAPYAKAYNDDGTWVIAGTSDYPLSPVLATFVYKGDGRKIFISGETDERGQFTFVVPEALAIGTYLVSVTVVLPDGTYSAASESLTIIVGGFLGVHLTGALLAFFVLTVLGFLALVLALIWRLDQARGVRGLFSKLVLGEIRQAEDVVHKSFKILRDDVRSAMKEKHGPLRKELLVELEDDLEDAEDVIHKEIDDIRDALHDEKN